VLRVDGNDVCVLDDDERPLGFYSVPNGAVLHIIDTNPYSLSAGGGLEDTSLVKKYVMSDEEYNKRKNTLRSYKREQLKKDPNFKFDFGKGGPKSMVNGQPAAKSNKENKQVPGPESVQGINVGARCEVQPGGRRGVVSFVGEVSGIAPGHWVGVTFDEPVGKSDGCVKGKRIFDCMPKYGGFIRGPRVAVGDFPEVDPLALSDSDDSDEEL